VCSSDLAQRAAIGVKVDDISKTTAVTWDNFKADLEASFTNLEQGVRDALD
jgi:hypothetical protein